MTGETFQHKLESGEKLFTHNPFTVPVRVTIKEEDGLVVEFLAGPRQYFAVTQGRGNVSITYTDFNSELDQPPPRVGDIAQDA